MHIVRECKRWVEHSTRTSNVVSHRTTILARRSLASESGRVLALSAWYGRDQALCCAAQLYADQVCIGVCMPIGNIDGERRSKAVYGADFVMQMGT